MRRDADLTEAEEDGEVGQSVGASLELLRVAELLLQILVDSIVQSSLLSVGEVQIPNLHVRRRRDTHAGRRLALVHKTRQIAGADELAVLGLERPAGRVAGESEEAEIDDAVLKAVHDRSASQSPLVLRGERQEVLSRGSPRVAGAVCLVADDAVKADGLEEADVRVQLVVVADVEIRVAHLDLPLRLPDPLLCRVDVEVAAPRRIHPLLAHSQRSQDQRPAHLVVGAERQSLYSLTQSHLVAQDSAAYRAPLNRHTYLLLVQHPANPLLLVRRIGRARPDREQRDSHLDLEYLLDTRYLVRIGSGCEACEQRKLQFYTRRGKEAPKEA